MPVEHRALCVSLLLMLSTCWVVTSHYCRTAVTELQQRRQGFVTWKYRLYCILQPQGPQPATAACGRCCKLTLLEVVACLSPTLQGAADPPQEPE